VQDLIAAIGIACFERQIVIVLLSYASVYAAVVIARERTFSRSGWTKAVTQAISTASSIAIGLALCIVALRWFALYRARKSVSKDKMLYDGIWKSMLNNAVPLEVIRDEVPTQYFAIPLLLHFIKLNFGFSQSMFLCYAL
jgi:hypothetical protein